MYRLLEFIRRSYVTLLFVVFEVVAIGIYARSTYYTQATILARANAVTGGLAGAITDIGGYFSLAKENRALTERVAELEQRLAFYDGMVDTSREVDISELQYEFMPARVVSSSINRSRNFITLNKGLRDGVMNDMAVLSPSGEAVGYILDCSERYSVAISILNTSFRTGCKIKGDGYSGSIEWNGGSPYEVTMCELSKYAQIEVGAEVVTTGVSHYFPSDMRIGWVESFELDDSKTYYNAKVRLAADFSNLYNVVLVKYIDREEVVGLEQRAKGMVY
ncbi:MAG: rod shape-determining protein MreC [Alistipes sp.]|nr:rod shape-determining protein MreC [Alistipes sp.]MBQ7342429.1 rod shape-determining protein MreC [Alistipes sp.]